VRDSYIAALKALLPQEPDSISTTDRFGMTPLDPAAITGNKDITEGCLNDFGFERDLGRSGRKRDHRFEAETNRRKRLFHIDKEAFTGNVE
jgi:hypothetical protein